MDELNEEQKKKEIEEGARAFLAECAELCRLREFDIVPCLETSARGILPVIRIMPRKAAPETASSASVMSPEEKK